MGDVRRYAALAVVVLLVLAGAWALTARSDGEAATAGTSVDVVGIGAVPEVGQAAPDFTATTLDGEEVTLSQFAGQPVWLTFGATWCAACRTEFPDIQAAWEDAEADGVVVLAAYLAEDADDVRAYAERAGLTFTHVPDPREAVAGRFHVLGVPMHYFIDRDGVVHALKFGVLSPEQMSAELAGISG